MLSLLRRARHWSEQLTVRVTVAVALSIVAFAAAAVMANVREGRGILVEKLINKTDDLGSFIADLAASHVDELRALELKVIAEDVARQREVALVEIVDQNGNVLADGDNNKRSLLKKTRQPIVAKALASGEKLFVNDGAFLDAVIPVKLGSKLVGAVYLKMSQ